MRQLSVWLVSLALPAMLQAGESVPPAAVVDPDDDFDLGTAELTSVDGSAAVELPDSEFVGNPLHRLLGAWPEDLVVAPVPGRSPELGWTLAVLTGWFIGTGEDDSEQNEPPPSIVGAFGMLAENDSYAYGAGAKLNLFDDRLRMQIATGYFDISYRFYGIGNDAGDLGLSVPIEQDGPIASVSATGRVWEGAYAGLGLFVASVDTRVRLGQILPPVIPDPTLSIELAALNVPLQYDTRDHEQFPRSGWLVDGKARLFREAVGSDVDAEVYEVAVNRYLPVRERDVLALRGYARLASGDAPFFLLSTFGGSTDLRGYDIGRYRDSALYALQGEYRWSLDDRWILTGFAGLGEVADSFGSMFSNFLPAAGVGARFVLSQKHRVSLAADIAVGRNGTEYYFGVGEAF